MVRTYDNIGPVPMSETLMGHYVEVSDYHHAIAQRDEWKEKEQITSELFEAACNDLGDAQATLDALREAVPEYFTPENNYLWQNSLAKVLDILYPAKKGEANGF